MEKERSETEAILNTGVPVQLGGCGKKPKYPRQELSICEPLMSDTWKQFRWLHEALKKSANGDPVKYQTVFEQFQKALQQSKEGIDVSVLAETVSSLPNPESLYEAAARIGADFADVPIDMIFDKREDGSVFSGCSSGRQVLSLVVAYVYLIGLENIMSAFLAARDPQATASDALSSTSAAN